jgi:1,2-diacylglycerol 3-beta-galactosyltransferase
MSNETNTRVPMLFLISDTGGGHRSAALAVSQALELSYPGRFAPIIEDPLQARGAPARLRRVTALYGPAIRLTPWLWGAIWHSSNSRCTFWMYERALFAAVYRMVAAAVVKHRPAVIVSFHAMTSRPAVRARNASLPRAPVVTVITDLITPHKAWRYGEVDWIVVPSAQVQARCQLDGIDGERFIDLGLPVRPEFSGTPQLPADRASLRRSLGASGDRFLVVVVGGAEGSGDLVRRAAALVRRLEDIEVVALCGRNARARRRLTRLAAKAGGRLTVKGFVDNMADWLRCADVVVTKAGPGTIAEATSCGAPLILTSYVPGQEHGNANFVVHAGAGRYIPTVRRLIAELDRLRRDPATLDGMRAASARLGRPAAALDIAALLASLATPEPMAGPSRETAAAPSAGQGASRASNYLGLSFCQNTVSPECR